MVPQQCFRVRLDVHRTPLGGAWCYAVEVSDPHTQELLAMVVEPAREATTAAGIITQITQDVRVLLYDLTDPDPF